MREAKRALERARHELTTLHGLVAADGEAPHETWEIDESACIARIDAVLAAQRTLTERIEAAYDDAVRSREAMFNARATLDEREGEAKLEHADDWAAAKNNDVRAVMLASWLRGDDVYQRVRTEYEEARDTYRLGLLEIERLKLLVEAEKADAARYAG